MSEAGVEVHEDRKCWSCEMPQPDWPKSLHLDECPEHDPETCVVCEDEDA